jgi:disulfide bond formation protein DsbB|tara:strand:- start:579 stop:1061 length:483 start_codon:yes stop_codon:yes gene_type:complete
MFKKKNHIFLIFLLFAISASLIAAFIIEYGLGHQPCKLCIYERVPYILSIFLILEIIFLNKKEKIALLLLSLIFFFSSLLAFYHFGIEQSLFDGLSVCESKDSFENLSKEQLLAQLKENTVSCKNVTFTILGLSLATINSIFSLVLSVIFLKLYLNYEKN